jgi:D-alanyl-D-alanine carboxypeptidase
VLDSTFLQACEDAAARFEVPAMAVGVASADGTIELHALGCDLDARFRIASVTKPMTASLALRLLNLEAGTGVWPDEVRVQHLLSHMSGFACELGDAIRFGDGDDALGVAVAELDSVVRLVDVDIAWSYSNTGYWLAGWLAAQAAGTTFEDALRRHVFGPAGMANTGFDDPDLAGTGPGASSAPYPRARRPSGGIVADVADVLRFGRWQLTEPWAAALRRTHGKPVSGVYGLGLFGERVGGVEVWGHPGSSFGYQSSLLLVPDRGAAFGGLTNSGSGKRALDEVEQLWLERVVGSGRRHRETSELTASELAAFAGTYGNSDTRVVVSPGGDGLIVDVTDQLEQIEVSARPIGERRFEVVGGDFAGDLFDFPLDRFARFGSELLPQVA